MMNQETKTAGDAAALLQYANEQSALRAVLTSPAPIYIGENEEEKPFLPVPNGRGGVELLSLQKFAGRKRRAMVTLCDEESLVDYLATFREDNTRVFLEPSGVRAVIDYHSATIKNEVGRGYHEVRMPLEHTPEAAAWLKNNNLWLEQDEFARFALQWMPTFVEPAGADMYALAQTMEGTTGATWANKHRLHDGERKLKWEETVEARGQDATAGEMAIPSKLTVALALWPGVPARRFEAQFRYRVKSGALRLSYELIGLTRAVDEARKDLIARLSEKTGIRVWNTHSVSMGYE